MKFIKGRCESNIVLTVGKFSTHLMIGCSEFDLVTLWFYDFLGLVAKPKLVSCCSHAL